MSSVAFMAPFLPGGADLLKSLAKEINGPRKVDVQDFHKRMKISTENWYIQSTPQGDFVIVYLEAEDFGHTFKTLAESNNSFDVWFKEQAKAVHGIDFNKPPQGPMPEMIYSSRS